MRDRKIWSMAAMALLVLGAAALWGHHGPDDVVLNAAGAKAKQAPVQFPHALHVKSVESCDTCHHNHEGMTSAANVEVATCASCHLKPEEGVPGILQAGLRNNPYHIKCISCHREESKGPTACADCHPRS